MAYNGPVNGSPDETCNGTIALAKFSSAFNIYELLEYTFKFIYTVIVFELVYTVIKGNIQNKQEIARPIYKLNSL